MAQAKPRTTSTGALTAPTFEPSQHLSVTPFSALTAEESSAISYTVSEAGVATKFDLPPREIPQTVVVTTQKLIKDFNLTDVKQILQFTPGIYVENERNVGAYQYFSRGYQLQVQFDGVPSAVRIGDRDAVSLDSAMIDRVEVLQGAAGLLTGAGAPGGTINIVRKMPTKTQSGYVEATAGPWDGGRLVADVSTPIDASGKVRARLVGVYNYDDSYIDYVYNRQGMFYGVVQADLTRRETLQRHQRALSRPGLWRSAQGYAVTSQEFLNSGRRRVSRLDRGLTGTIFGMGSVAPVAPRQGSADFL